MMASAAGEHAEAPRAHNERRFYCADPTEYDHPGLIDPDSPDGGLVAAQRLSAPGSQRHLVKASISFTSLLLCVPQQLFTAVQHIHCF
jgi:hypothetical protein